MKPRVRFIVPVWGEHYIKRFLNLSTPSFLAAGNLPALAEMTDLETVILTCRANYLDFEKEPAFQSLRRVAPLRFTSIDDLVVDQVYGVTLTLAYLRGVTDTGDNMVNMHFLFINSDFVLADGSLRSVAKHILDGRRIILTSIIRATSEDLEESLRHAVDSQTHVLPMPPRQLVSMAMQSLHPTQIAKIVNNDLCHSIHVNQFYWQVDSNTLVSKHFLMFMLCLKPERVVTEVHSFCDYSFVPEMCPSGGAVAMDDSDDFFALELQNRESENSYLRIGRPTLDEIARSLSAWTTRVHREDSLNHTLIFHGSDLPKSTGAMCQEADCYIRAIHQRLDPEPKPFRHHPYWVGAYAAWENRKAYLNKSEAPSSRSDATLPDIRKPLTQRVIHGVYRWLFGCPPRVPAWHPDWLDYRVVTRLVDSHFARQDKKLLHVKHKIGLFDNSLGAVDVITIAQILEGGLDKYASDHEVFTLTLVEPQRDELRHIRAVVEKLKPFMASGGQIIVFFKNQTQEPCPMNLAHELIRLVGFVAPVELNKTSVFYAGGEVKKIFRKTLNCAISLYARGGPLTLPFVAVLVSVVIVLSAVNNRMQRAAQDRRASVQDCSSFLMTIDI